MAKELTGTAVSLVVTNNFLEFDVDGTKEQPPFNTSFTHISALTANHLVIEDGAKGIDKAYKIALSELFESDGTTALDTPAKVVTYLSDKIG